MNTVIVVDSCCDLPLTYIEENSDYIDVIGMPVSIEGVDYIDDLGKTFKHEMLYKKLREGIMPSTAQINTYRFSQLFEKHVGENKSIIYIGLSSSMSGTNNNAIQSIELVKETYPDADIQVMSSISASIGQGLLAIKAVEMLKNKSSANEVFKWLEDNEIYANHWFAVNDLNYLKNGGRITPAQAAVGTLLNVKPILIVDNDGTLRSFTKIKGRKKSIKFLLNKFKEHYDQEKCDKILIGHGNTEAEAIQLKNMLSEHIGEDKIIVTELSATIASHVGPGMLALGFMGSERV